MTMGGESNRDVDRSLGGFFGSIVSVRGVIAERLSV